MRQHTVTIEGRHYHFSSEPDPVDRHRLVIKAPGVVVFEVDDADGHGAARARDILRGIYHDYADVLAAIERLGGD